MLSDAQAKGLMVSIAYCFFGKMSMRLQCKRPENTRCIWKSPQNQSRGTVLDRFSIQSHDQTSLRAV